MGWLLRQAARVGASVVLSAAAAWITGKIRKRAPSPEAPLREGREEWTRTPPPGTESAAGPQSPLGSRPVSSEETGGREERDREYPAI